MAGFYIKCNSGVNFDVFAYNFEINIFLSDILTVAISARFAVYNIIGSKRVIDTK